MSTITNIAIVLEGDALIAARRVARQALADEAASILASDSRDTLDWIDAVREIADLVFAVGEPGEPTSIAPRPAPLPDMTERWGRLDATQVERLARAAEQEAQFGDAILQGDWWDPAVVVGLDEVNESARQRVADARRVLELVRPKD